MGYNTNMKSRNNAIAIISILSLQHFLVDFLCALTMYGILSVHLQPGLKPMYYNLLAFALQMPFGALADWLPVRKNQSASLLCILLAIVCLAFGIRGSVLALGLGNALFHVGGGILTIEQDNDKGFKGRGLGSFVAPGAIGLTLGILLGKQGRTALLTAGLLLVVLLFALLLYIYYRDKLFSPKIQAAISADCLPMVLFCLFVVIIRSLTGLSVAFSWKDTTLEIILCTVALAAGKCAGGFAQAEFGMKKTIIVTLALSAVCYLLSDIEVFGILALFLFNMTMPLTLYMLARKLPQAVGLAFGILTFGLFIGYLPYVFGLLEGVSGQLIGFIGSILSLVILLAAEREQNTNV